MVRNHMRRNRALLVVATFAMAVVVLLAGCRAPFSPDGGSDTLLPVDEINDVARGTNRSFTFETIATVQLDLDVDLYETDESGVVQGDKLSPDTERVYIVLKDSKENVVYTGMFAQDGTLDAGVRLPAAPEDMVIELRASGFVRRSILVPRMVELETVRRTLVMQRIVSGVNTGMSRSVTSSPDSDGDGVPDAQDAYPNDPTVAFKMHLPADGPVTVAFEDLFGRANAGDADYNDFIATYSIEEALTPEGLVSSISVQADARTKLAGYNHRFGIRIDSFSGAATLERTYIDSTGESVTVTERATAPLEIDLFMNSRTAVGKSGSFTLTFSDPQDRSAETDVEPLSEAPYNPYVLVHNTGHDIHLIGREPNVGSINPGDEFVDGSGFPWALLVPTDWIHPEEAQRIEVPYPRFTLWRESGGTEHTDWYEHYQDPYVPPAEDPVVYVAGYYNDGTKNVAAYWVDDGTSVTPVDLHSSDPGESTDVFVDGSGVVHAVGWYSSTDGQISVYWRAGEAVVLDAGARATGVVVDSGGVAYVSGYYSDGAKNVAAYWTVNGDAVARYDLKAGARSSATGIALVSSGTVHVSGYVYDGTKDLAVYWRSVDGVVETETLYATGFSRASAIEYEGGSTYMAGQYVDVDVFAAYWVGSSEALVTLDGAAATARSIARSDGQTIVVGDYVSGGTVRRPAIWTGASPTDLPTDPVDISGFAYGLAIRSGVVYVAGSQLSDVEEAVYWKDGLLIELSSSVRSRANSIGVGP